MADPQPVVESLTDDLIVRQLIARQGPRSLRALHGEIIRISGEKSISYPHLANIIHGERSGINNVAILKYLGYERTHRKIKGTRGR